MTRHEAAEALGAIGGTTCIELLKSHAKIDVESEQVVRETCELAIAKIEHDQLLKESGQNAVKSGPYDSIDPAPPLPQSYSISQLSSQLMNTSIPLFDRYRAMFALRNKATAEAVHALGQGFADTSALFRHEIAYVFGQMQHVDSIPYLIATLKKQNESEIVRHECAEALGSIGSGECLPILKEYMGEAHGGDAGSKVVGESCVIGLDMWEWENETSVP